jgi:acido-empty-quinoprotein group A
MKIKKYLFASILALLFAPSALFAQGPLDPSLLLKPATDAWPSYHGDYSGRHYSTLKQIDASNVKGLTLAWIHRVNLSPDGAITGGEGPESALTAGGGMEFGGPTIKAIPLMVNGVLYFAMPDHAFAVDARTGRQIWHYVWKTRGGIHIGNRGMGMYGDYLFFETPDNYVVSLDARTGKERWHKLIADVKQEYFSTPAPLVIRNHVIIGMGGDSLDVPGWLESRDPETGEIQWKWYTTPRKGEPGFETWPDEYSAAHGGGMPWQPPTYDPELNLLYVPTGNPNPVLAGQSRNGDNLWTASIVALNPDTGKMVWWFQCSPHDTHDWDATQVPVLIDGQIDGRPRKLLAQASRNGFFFLLDRTNGKNILTKPFIESMNWYKGIDEKGQPIRDPEKDPQIAGALVSPTTDGATNWPAPSFNPDTGLFYVGTSQSYSLFYLTDTDPRPQGWGAAERGVGNLGNYLRAIDYKTGKVVWKHSTLVGAQGLLSTAGGLLFGGDGAGNFVAYDPMTGKPLWHAGLTADPSNAPQTYMLDGRQYVVVGAGDSLFAFMLQK